jgi:DNA-binding beta-propeller fold protein YncE
VFVDSRRGRTVLVTSAGPANGGGRDALLRFDAAGGLYGRFTHDPRVSDPRGMTLDPTGTLIYVNTTDRVVALDFHGRVALDSGPVEDLDPGGAVFGPDGRLYVTLRRRRTILGMSHSLGGHAEALFPDDVVPFPRGFAFGPDRSLYLASGIGPSGDGDNAIVVFDLDSPGEPHPLVTDCQLSPLDMTLAPNGNIVVASEFPFGATDAVVTLREYDPESGDLVRVFAPDRSAGFRKPRGLRFTADGHLYCVGEEGAVAFDFATGGFVGEILRLARLNGQALVLFDEPHDA